jgi:hypothetical protein
VGRAGVTWSAGQDFGVEFMDMDPQERERLQRLIEEIQEGKTNIH